MRLKKQLSWKSNE
jgi:hypothetical protein